MIIGRKKEQEILKELYLSNKSEFLALYGRRRIGKTYLIRNYFSKDLVFDYSANNSNSIKDQLLSFQNALEDHNFKGEKPFDNWLNAFQNLKRFIEKSSKKRKVIFLDEVAWMDTAGSNFIYALESFWNGWCSKRNDILLIICSSVSSYILNKVIHNTGGLYNRVSREILLKPFTLTEVKEYLNFYGVKLDEKSIVELYMCLGGIPYYYTFVKKGKSSSKIINDLFFSKGAPLEKEYEFLFKSQFKDYPIYEQIMSLLSNKKIGYTREEIKNSLNLTDGGMITRKLQTLIDCGFVREYLKYGNKKKDSLYQIIDNFVLFHNNFLKKPITDENYWIQNKETTKVKAWEGLSYEIVTLQHIDKIKEKLGITGVNTECYSYVIKSDDVNNLPSSQIDLLLDRQDNIIDIIEAKFSKSEYVLSKKEAINIANKIDNFKRLSKTKKAINVILMTTYGLKQNQYSNDIDLVITINDLF